MTIHKQQQQQRRVSAWMRRPVGNQRLLLVGLFLLTAWYFMRQYRNDQTEDQTFFNNLLSSIGLGSAGNHGGYFSSGARVGRDEDGMAYSVDYMSPGYKAPSERTKYHVILPCDGRVYHEWQARVFYYWYKRIKESRNPKGMGGFTRILHSGKEDEWMHELPTVVVKPLSKELEDIAQGFVLLNRPHAVKEWVERCMPKIPEHFVLLAEPDHLFIRAPPLWATYTRMSAFPFSYMDSKDEKNAKIIQKYNPKGLPLRMFRPMGPSPLMISKKQLAIVAEPWFNISFSLKQDVEANETWGWISEMYGFSIAAALSLGNKNHVTMRPEFMVQPPWDSDLNGKNGKRAAFIHYTYSNDFDSEGSFTPAVIGKWHFDKRDYIHKYPLIKTKRPPPGCSNAATKLLIKCINIAARSLDGWKERAYQSPDEIIKYFGFEGDVLDIAEPGDDSRPGEDEDYSDEVELDDIDYSEDVKEEEEYEYSEQEKKSAL